MNKDLKDYEQIGIPSADSCDEEVIETTETELVDLIDIEIFEGKQS